MIDAAYVVSRESQRGPPMRPARALCPAAPGPPKRTSGLWVTGEGGIEGADAGLAQRAGTSTSKGPAPSKI